MESTTIPRCPVCGEPATVGERDIRQLETTSAWAEYEPASDWRYGCKNHRPERGQVLYLNKNRNKRITYVKRQKMLAYRNVINAHR